MLFVPLTDFAGAQESGASLVGHTAEGENVEIPHDSLCCLHADEWQGAKPYIEAAFA